MRLLLIESPAGTADAVARLVGDGGASVTSTFVGSDSDTVIVRAPNQDTEAIVAAVREVPDASVTLVPHEIMLLTPDDHAGRRQEQGPQPRAATEVYLRGLKTVGTWSSFILYAVIAGVLGWVALWQSSVFVLVGAVLVAPYPSAALNTAVATACGDARLLVRSIVRYFSALAVGVATAYVMSVAAGLELPTDLMQTFSFISYTAVLLPVAGGAAAALYLSQSEESSLISAAAAGVLVTVALVPPVAVMGMSLALGDWDAARRALFVLVLQIVGINVVAPVVLWAYRVRPDLAWIDRGSRGVAAASFVASVLALGALLVWQFTDPPSLGRPTIARDIQEQIVAELRDDPDVDYVGAEVRFATARTGEPDLLLGTVYVRPRGAQVVASLEEELRRRLQRLIESHGHDVVPLITVTALPPPPD